MSKKVLTVQTPYGTLQRFAEPEDIKSIAWCGVALHEGGIVYSSWGKTQQQCAEKLFAQAPKLEHRYFPVGGSRG